MQVEVVELAALHTGLPVESRPRSGPYRSNASALMMPELSTAVTLTLMLLAVAPTVTLLSPSTTTLVILVSPYPPSAWAAGTARADRARAPETAATVARMRMCVPHGWTGIRRPPWSTHGSAGAGSG